LAKLPEVLTVPEIEAMLAAPGVDDRRGVARSRVARAGSTAPAARLGTLRLGLPDLVLDEGLVRVFGKGGKERLVPLGRQSIGAISVYLHNVRPELDKVAPRAAYC
jgi:integrase/recombinase XerD